MNNQTLADFHFVESDLAARTSARYRRIEVEQAIASNKTIVIDLTNVLSVSESYADELFAVLVKKHGLEWFSTNIKLQHASKSVLLSIATAIRRRLENQDTRAIKASVHKIMSTKKSGSLINTGRIEYRSSF
jgi:anti-anti-sigma regulatory factor